MIFLCLFCSRSQCIHKLVSMNFLLIVYMTTITTIIVVIATDRFGDYWGKYVSCNNHESFLNRTISMVIIANDLWLFTTTLHLIVYPKVFDNKSFRNGQPIPLLWGYIYPINDTIPLIKYDGNISQTLLYSQGTELRTSFGAGIKKFGRNPNDLKDYLIEIKMAISFNHHFVRMMREYVVTSDIIKEFIFKKVQNRIPKIQFSAYSFIENDDEFYQPQPPYKGLFERENIFWVRFASHQDYVFSFIYESIKIDNVILRIYDATLQNFVGQMCHDPSVDRITSAKFFTDCNVFYTLLYPPFDFGFYHDDNLYLVFTSRPMVIKINKTIQDLANEQHEFEILHLDELFKCRPKN